MRPSLDRDGKAPVLANVVWTETSKHGTMQAFISMGGHIFRLRHSTRLGLLCIAPCITKGRTTEGVLKVGRDLYANDGFLIVLHRVVQNIQPRTIQSFLSWVYSTYCSIGVIQQAA